MASPWVTPQRPPADRPWMGMAMLAALPLLSLILIRMLWSGSSLWFLTVGLILLGASAVMFLARRPQEHEYSRGALAPEQSRVPIVLAALGVVFLAMLLLPNFADGDSKPRVSTGQTPGLTTDAAGVQQQPQQQALPTAQQQAPAQQQQPSTNGQSDTSPEDVAPAEDSQTYVVQDGDNLWDIAQTFGVSVDDIVAANELDNPEDIAIGDELIIPASAAADSGEATSEDTATDDTTSGTEEEPFPAAVE